MGLHFSSSSFFGIYCFKPIQWNTRAKLWVSSSWEPRLHPSPWPILLSFVGVKREGEGKEAKSKCSSISLSLSVLVWTKWDLPLGVCRNSLQFLNGLILRERERCKSGDKGWVLWNGLWSSFLLSFLSHCGEKFHIIPSGRSMVTKAVNLGQVRKLK